MSNKPYRVISVLLVCSVLAVLALQAFWIRNFYLQKLDQFDHTVYSALEYITGKLQERENMKAVKEQVLEIKKQNRLAPKREKIVQTFVTASSGYAQTANRIANGRQQISFGSAGAGVEVETVNVSDSMVMFTKSTGIPPTIVSTHKTVHIKEKTHDEVGKLIDKVLMEIKLLDTDEKDPDTLKTLIEKALQNKGIFHPFEFAVKKVFKNKMETLVQSKGYDTMAVAYRSDLSANKVFSTHNFLFLQFPGINTLVMHSMKNIVILSLLFSLLIVGVFFYTMRLIFNQKKLSEIKSDFVNNMTHELKTPIATISLALDAIKNPQVKNDEASFNNYGRILKEENHKLNNHVERVLQMALLDKGELRLNKTKVDLVSVMETAIDNYKLQIAERKARTYFIPPIEKVFMKGDEQHLQTVFSNLLDNALKYSNGNCIININMERGTDEIKVVVKDNGIGIDKENKEKVFDKFYRAQGGNLHDVKGFGLGLSYAKSIVEAHGGSIGVVSEKGKGCEFVIRFRRQD
jgi:two-component system phosphate regulon sensor histidine kinase PhoR